MSVASKDKTRGTSPRTCWCLEIEYMDYLQAHRLQLALVTARRDRVLDRDIVVCLEHPPVFTIGRRGGLQEHFTARDRFEKSGIPVVRVERGGLVTYHGPGQLVVYPIIDLRNARIKLADYITGLEEVMIRTASDFGVPAERNPLNRGIWVGTRKLGSIGITIRRGISFHGFAFNVNLSLEPFAWINPCGLRGVAVTSLEQELSHKASMERVRDTVKHHLETVFGLRFTALSFPQVEKLLGWSLD